MDELDLCLEQLEDSETNLAQQNLRFEAEYQMDLLKDEVLTDATEVCGTAWGNLKGTAMKAGYELSDEF